MSQAQMQSRRILDEHFQITAEESSPFVEQMENYYLANTPGFRGKIMIASWIPRSVRVHMINHIQAVLQRRTMERRHAAKVTFAVFVRTPEAKSAQSKRFRYGKHVNGTVYKQDRRTGRFARFSQREREVLRHGKQR